MTDRHFSRIISRRTILIILAIVAFGCVIWQLMEWKKAVIVVGTAYILFIVLWKLPKWQLFHWKNRVDPAAKIEPKDFINAENSARATLAQIVGGIFVLVGLYFTAENLRNSQKTLEATQERQITESFTKAIDQLGNTDKPDISIGGIYSLGRVARDSRRDHWPIVQVLSSYIQRVAPLKQAEIGRLITLCDPTELPEDGIIHEVPASNVQAVMSVLGDRRYDYENGKDQYLNISRSSLRRISLQEAHFERARFIGNDMKGAIITRSHLEGSLLNHSLMSFTNLEGTYLDKAHLVGVCLIRSNLSNARLNDTNLSDADLRYTVLDKTDLTGADLTRVKFQGTDLRNVIGISWEQLRKAQVDCNTLLPPDIEVQRRVEQLCN